MTDLRPFLVTAPLTIEEADNLDTNTIYVFDYSNSFPNEENKSDKLITYLESFGGMFDIFVPLETPYEEKEALILNYFSAGSFFNVYSLTQTLIHVLFYSKNIKYMKNKSIFTDNDVMRFVDRNKMFMKQVTDFFNSLFLVMLLYSSQPTKEMKDIKRRYPKERFNVEELSPNLCCPLLDEYFYLYYEKHVGNDLYYYTFLFDNRLYKSMTFIDILTNKNNTLLPLLLDLNNKKFQEFIEKNKKES